MYPIDSILFVVFLSLAASATAQVARNVRIEGQQFIEMKVHLNTGNAISGTEIRSFSSPRRVSRS